jgi:S-adenosylmethionine-diacylgycerolhomoserine-N-methlytransferase
VNTSSSDRTRDHFALMDKVYRHQRHVYDFSRRYFLFGRDRLIAGLGARPGESVLEVGCGTARNLIRISRRCSADLYGLDASSEMLRSAQASLVRTGLTSRVHLARGLAEEVTPAMFGRTEPFDHVVLSYSLSMIPDWRGALRAAHGTLAATGTVHIVDFGDFRRLYPLFARGLRWWIGLYHVTPRTELLKEVEAAGRLGNSPPPQILPGRYAFVWRGSRDDLQRLAGSPVA